jgi:NADH-quinone oxidoreductase subunit H
MANYLFYFLIFPGFLFAAAGGGILSWFDRKITARVQFRKGPPFLQPFYDVLKLLGKETLVPRNSAKIPFLYAPVFALTGATLAAVFILLPSFGITSGFRGDLIVIYYFLTVPSISWIIGAMATGNPLAITGASREMKLILSYELAFLLILAAIIYKSGMTLNLADIIDYQKQNGALAGSLSGILLLIAFIFCIQAKLGLVPFDMAEAETEITAGMFIEYSGFSYALVKLTRYILLFILPSFLVVLFLGGFQWSGTGIVWSVLKLLAVVLVLTLIRNTNPRLKLGQAMRFFFVGMNLLVIAAFVLSLYGL